MLGTCPRAPISRPALSQKGRLPLAERCFWGMAALGAAGISFGAKAQSLGVSVASGLGPLPGGHHFRIYLGHWQLPGDQPRQLPAHCRRIGRTPCHLELDRPRGHAPQKFLSKTSSASPDGGFPASAGRGSSCRRSSTRSESGQELWRSASTPTSSPTRRALRLARASV